jgi:hypothetical protein
LPTLKTNVRKEKGLAGEVMARKSHLRLADVLDPVVGSGEELSS